MLDQISRLVDAKVTVEANGMATVLVGGAPLVMGARTVSLGLNTDDKGIYKVIWDSSPETHPGTAVTGRSADDSNDMEVATTSGELMGLLEARGNAEHSKLGQQRNLVPVHYDTLNQLARAMVLDTNAVHQQGTVLTTLMGPTPMG